MAIDWGSWVYKNGNGMRVGVEVSWSGVDHYSSSVTATVNIYTANQYNYSDAQTVTATGDIGGATNYTNSQASGTQTLRTSRSYTYNYSTYGSSPGNVTFGATVTGTYNGITPTVSYAYSIPARPAIVPTMSYASATANIGSVTVSWAASSNGGSGIDYYRIYRNGAYIGDFGGNSHTDNVGNGATVYYDVYAHNAVGFSSNARSNTVTTPSPPAAPPIAQATGGVGTVTVDWNAPSDGGTAITGYTVQRNGTTVATPDANTTIYPDSGLAANTTYTYTVYAINAAGTGTTSTVTATTLGGLIGVWNGTTFVKNLPKVWNGTQWVTANARVWAGTEWKYAT